MRISRDARFSPCVWGPVETGRREDGGINGALDEHLGVDKRGDEYDRSAAFSAGWPGLGG
ncbi:hypothetical protein GCM10023339_38220 [Alloalcanivorax gelatiniphagus]